MKTNTGDGDAICVCKFVLAPAGSKRASSDPDEFEVKPAEEQKAEPPGMTDEQKEFLRWFYRTEDRKCCSLQRYCTFFPLPS